MQVDQFSMQLEQFMRVILSKSYEFEVERLLLADDDSIHYGLPVR